MSDPAPAAKPTKTTNPPASEDGGDININITEATKPTEATQIAEQALKIDRLEKENDAAKKAGVIVELNAFEVDTKDFEKIYTFDSLVAMRDLKKSEAKEANTFKTATGETVAKMSFDPGWLDHKPAPGYPTGVWRSSVDDSIIKDARNRDLAQEQRSK